MKMQLFCVYWGLWVHLPWEEKSGVCCLLIFYQNNIFILQFSEKERFQKPIFVYISSLRADIGNFYFGIFQVFSLRIAEK